MMPAYDRIVSFARNNSIPLISVDSDGLVKELLPTITSHGVNVFFPFEVQAGNDIREYRRAYPALGIMGGLDKSALAKTQKDINRELCKAEEMLGSGGYIVGFDHLIPPDVPWKHFKYAVEELRRMILG